MPTVADTAFSIAVVRAEESHLPERERLFEDPYAAIFAAGGEHVREATQRYLDLPFFRELVRLRTRWLDDAVRAALAAGLRQLVLLGAGFDARALRMREIEETGTRCFEIDVPSQLARKEAMLAAAGVALPRRVVLVPFDFDAGELEAELPGELASRGFRLGAGAVFVWEGVIGYVTRGMIDASLRFMARAGGATSRVVFTFGEGSFEPEGVEACALRAGFERVEASGLDDAWRAHWSSEPCVGGHMSKVATAFVGPRARAE